MNVTKALIGAFPLALWVGCSNPADNVPAASVRSATNSSAKAATPETMARYFAFGTNAATISFVGSKVTGKHDGGFRNFTGEFKVEDGHLADTGNKVAIDATSVWADNPRLTGHLKTPDFFNVRQFPTATFETVSIKQSEGNATVTGNLTLHGVTKEISFPATIQLDNDAVSVTAEFVLNRFDFDIIYKGMANDLIRKEVVLKLNVKATPGRADFASLDGAAQTAAAAVQSAPAPGGGQRFQRPAGASQPRPGGQRPGATQRPPGSP
jgi:polyisoprenoid-binding protein YceI